MKREDLSLLHNDICSRIPYELKCKIDHGDGDFEIKTLYYVTSDKVAMFLEDEHEIEHALEDIQPYLYPPCELPKELAYEYNRLLQKIIEHKPILLKNNIRIFLNFCFKNHIDVYGLIEKNLAINAAREKLNIYKHEFEK